MTEPARDDRILPVTRAVALGVIPFLVLAFIILYLFPQFSGERFAWQIKPSLMAVYMGAGYLGGAYLFLQTVVGRRWHRVAAGFPAVSAFTVTMLLATGLHWSRFDVTHFPFQLWLGLYVVTPILVPWLWWHNRPTDPGTAEPGDVAVPNGIRWAVRGLGAGMAFMAVIGFIAPQLLINLWPWSLTPLTARVLAGWGALLGVGNLVIARDTRWSAWRVGVESIALWHVLYLIGSVMHWQDFSYGRWLNWYTMSVIGVLLLIGTLYVRLEFERRRGSPA
jgi:hypothetical protein